MPPRYQARPTDLLTRVRNEMDALGRPGMAGTSRLGSNRGRGGGRGQSSVLTNLGGQEQATGQGQMLLLSATGDSIASGGDYVTFDAEVYRHGFDAAVGADGQTVTWPVSFAGGTIQVEWAWDSYEGGGTIEIEVDGAVPAWGEVVAGTAGQTIVRSRPVHLAAGQQVKIKVTQTSGSAQTADVLVSFVAPDPAGFGEWKLVETVWLETRNNDDVTSSTVLAAGAPYRVVATGNYDIISTSTQGGDALLFPSSGQGASNDAVRDAELWYMGTNSTGHIDWFKINLGSGLSHVEPTGGPYATPTSGHAYEYLVTGEGSTVTFDHGDSPTNDNNGQFKIEIYKWVGD